MHPGSRSPIAWAVGAGADYAARRAEVEAMATALRMLPKGDALGEKFAEDLAEAMVYLEMEGAEYRDAFASLAPWERAAVLRAFGRPDPGAPEVLRHPALGEAVADLNDVADAMSWAKHRPPEGAPLVLTEERIAEAEGPDAAELAREARRDYERGLL
jgi:hypothetical protein